ncbi:nicotinate-nucleotide--dimethylbenzimidazole phosphoribosyltransferase [Kitasatospora sp. NPDC050543]|uniref:nicotinate-nucleotide--dimethylbenzimidazole phosphoribosyltransferase n=1 Tax=Kitasatospora sp. NPDC050543 TaxID=3364054 RepID=UPI0037924C24
MTDGGHVPSEGLPEHLLGGSDALGRPEGVAVPVAPLQGVAVQGIPAQGFPAQGAPVPGAAGLGAPLAGAPGEGPSGPAEPAVAIPGQAAAPQSAVQGVVPLAAAAPGAGMPGVGMPGTEGWTAEAAAPRPAFTFLDQPDSEDQLDDEDDLLLMPGPQGSWSEPVVLGAPPEQSLPVGVPGVTDTVVLRDADEQAAQPAPGTPVEPSWPPLNPSAADAQTGVPGAESVAQGVEVPVQAAAPVVTEPAAAPAQPQAQDQLTAAQQPRRPLHAGPPIPDPSLMTGHVPVRSLADRGPSVGGTPAHGVRVVPQPEPQVVAPAPVLAETPAPVAEVQVAEVQVEAQATEVPAAVEPSQVAVEPAALPEQPQDVQLAPEAAGLAAEPVAPETPAAAETPAEPVAEAVAAVDQAAQVEPAAEPLADAPQAETESAAEAPAAAPAQPRRIAAFLAAPAPHGLPAVEADGAQAQSVPIAPAESAESTEPAEASVQAPAEVPAEQPAPAPEQQEVPAEPAPAADAGAEHAEPVAEPVVEPVAEEKTTSEPTDQSTPVTAEPVTAEPATSPTAAGTGDMPSGQPMPVQEEQPPAATDAVTEPGQPDAATAAPEGEPAPEAGASADASDAPEPAAGEPSPAADPEPAGTDAPAEIAAEAAEPGPAAADGAAEAEEPVVAEEPAEPRPPAAPGYDEAGRDAVHQVIRERRDIRNGFRPDPIPHEVLIRVLEAAHTAPSVGYSQPWDFVVIRSAKTRRRMHELAERQRVAFAESLPKGRAKQFKEIKIEAILETPVNIVVTADRTRGGRHTLGRHTQPQMAPYSAALAVENLWLAARAEGLGVGWVSFFDDDEMVRELGLPEHLEVVAYLCVGYVDSFPEEPELQQQGWAKKRPLSWVVHEEQYGNRALPGEEPHSLLAETLRGIRPLDAKALGKAWERQKRMTKPAGSLGMLEIISAQLCGLSRKCPPPIPEPGCVAIFAGDHGVHAQGVTPWPQEVTAQMVGNFLAGGAVINSFATQIGTEVVVVDVGVASELPQAIQSGRTTGLLPRKVKPGTDDMTQGPAMSREEALKAIEVGIETARDLVAAGNKVLITGDMGIANTTPSAALIAVFAGVDPAEVTGRGTGIDDETHARKVEVVRAALALHQPDPADPIGVLAAVGGLEHAAIAGFLLGAASLRTPVILDGVIAGSAALAAKAIAPEVLAACIAGHRSAEPGHQVALAKLGLRPLIDLDLRLGEGTGALLALPLVQSAARSMHDVATFDSAGVTEKS